MERLILALLLGSGPAAPTKDAGPTGSPGAEPAGTAAAQPAPASPDPKPGPETDPSEAAPSKAEAPAAAETAPGEDGTAPTPGDAAKAGDATPPGDAKDTQPRDPAAQPGEGKSATDSGQEAAPASGSSNPFGPPAPGGEAKTAPAPEASPPAPAARARKSRPQVPTRALRYRLDLGLDGGSTVVGDGSYRAFDVNRGLPAVSVYFRADFPIADERIFLGAGIGYRRASADGTPLGGQLRTEATFDEPWALFRASFRLIEGIDPYVEAGVGPTIANLQLSSGLTGTQRAVIPRVDGLAGSTFYLVRNWLPKRGQSRVSAGFDLGAGYTYRGAIEVDPALELDEDPIPTEGAPLGTLQSHGFLWRIGAFIRVM